MVFFKKCVPLKRTFHTLLMVKKKTRRKDVVGDVEKKEEKKWALRKKKMN